MSEALPPGQMLLNAAETGNLERVKEILGSGAKIDHADEVISGLDAILGQYGRTALLYAARGGHVDVVKIRGRKEVRYRGQDAKWEM
eukprot:214318-Amorphochlora_amoeboformis.AAC.2